MEQDLTLGVALKFTVGRDGASPLLLLWKCWQRKGALRWELRRLVEGAGFEATSGNPLHRIIYKNYDVWLSALQACVLENIMLHIGKSCTSRDAAAAGSEEQEHWVSTAGLCLLYVYWIKHRQGRLHKALASKVLDTFLELTLGEADMHVLLAHSPIASCGAQVVHGCCHCVRLAKESMHGAETARASALRQRLVHLLSLIHISEPTRPRLI
eukprot:574582-Amphidinium_carterae.2